MVGGNHGQQTLGQAHFCGAASSLPGTGQSSYQPSLRLGSPFVFNRLGNLYFWLSTVDFPTGHLLR
eukprot:5641885-Pyramimonas_sp.AAC.1